MNKKELKKMIREQIRQELYEMLPDLIEESMQNIIKENFTTTERTFSNNTGYRKERKLIEKDGSFDKQKMAAMIGYETPPQSSITEIVGVSVDSGLKAKEDAAGQGQYRDYDDGVPSNDSAGDRVSDVPMDIVQALGKKAKKVLEETNRRENWRPGQ